MTHAGEKKQQRGQFFTVNNRVQELMARLLLNKPVGDSESLRAFEPSAGAGHLVKVLEDSAVPYPIDAVELDDTISPVCETDITHQDFFTFAEDKEGEYSAIIGNPPYVGWNKVEESVHITAAAVKSRYSDKANLYHLFIDRCIDLLTDGGEMVLIIPKEWLYTTSASVLRQKISDTGCLSHLVDCGEEKLFPDASVPALVIIRFVKGGDINDPTLSADSLEQALQGNYEQKKILSSGSRWMLVEKNLAEAAESDYVKLSDVFSVKVGMVSGADGVFRVSDDIIAEHKLEEETIRHYLTTKGVERFIDLYGYASFDAVPENTRNYLLGFKEKLMERGIRRFDESNWWEYGAVRNRGAMETMSTWISVDARTRRTHPFTVRREPMLFSGGTLGIYPKHPSTDVEKYAEFFNSEDFKKILRALFIMNGNKVSMQPATLHDALIPDFRDPEHRGAVPEPSAPKRQSRGPSKKHAQKSTKGSAEESKGESLWGL